MPADSKVEHHLPQRLRARWTTFRRPAGRGHACGAVAPTENLGNGTLSQWDKLRCSRADSPVVQARRLQREWKRRWPRSELPQLNHGCIDIEAAFRKILTAKPQYFAVAEWNETSRDVVYTELYGSRLYLWIWGGGHLLQCGTSGVVRDNAGYCASPLTASSMTRTCSCFNSTRAASWM